jgi:hypothetical protein
MDSDNPIGADNQQETRDQRVQFDARWVSGFVDGEGCFSVSFHRNTHVRRTRGWQIQAAFPVSQHERHRPVLEAMIDFVGCGSIRGKGPSSSVLTFTVWSLADLETQVIPRFECTRLWVKDHDFRRIADIVCRLRRKEHMTESGFEYIVRSGVRHEPSWQATITDSRGGPPGILRDCTPGPRRDVGVMIQSDPHGDMGNQAEMTWSPASLVRCR